MWIKCEFTVDHTGMYITPLVGFHSNAEGKSFWFGWLWWLWEFRLTKRAADGWLGSAFDAVLSINAKLQNFFVSITRR